MTALAVIGWLVGSVAVAVLFTMRSERRYYRRSVETPAAAAVQRCPEGHAIPPPEKTHWGHCPQCARPFLFAHEKPGAGQLALVDRPHAGALSEVSDDNDPGT